MAVHFRRLAGGRSWGVVAARWTGIANENLMWAWKRFGLPNFAILDKTGPNFAKLKLLQVTKLPQFLVSQIIFTSSTKH
jgi:hypothetical protein